MKEQPFQPDDLGFLISRGLDDDLSDDERRRLTEALSASDALRKEAESMRALHLLVRRWSRAPVEIDWTSHAALVEARCAEDADGEDRPAVDRILKRWAAGDVTFDEEQFTAGVMERLQRSSQLPKRRSRYRRLIRLGPPLAAAAALALALVGGPAFFSGSDALDPVSRVEFARSDSAPRAVVRFARGLPGDTPGHSNQTAPTTGESGRSEISFTAFGVMTSAAGVGAAVP